MGTEFVVIVTDYGAIMACRKEDCEKEGQTGVRYLWKKTNSGRERKYVDLAVDEAKIVSISYSVNNHRIRDCWIMVQDFWGANKKEKSKRGKIGGDGERKKKRKEEKSEPSNADVITLSDSDDEEDGFDTLDESYEYANPEEEFVF